MKFRNEDFFSKCDQIRSFQRIWSHLLKKPLMELHFLCNYKKCSDHTQTMQLQKDNVKIFAMEETKTQNSIGIY